MIFCANRYDLAFCKNQKFVFWRFRLLFSLIFVEMCGFASFFSAQMFRWRAVMGLFWGAGPGFGCLFFGSLRVIFGKFLSTASQRPLL